MFHGDLSQHFESYIFQCKFLNENICNVIEISLNAVLMVQIDNKLSSASVMSGNWTGDKPLPQVEPMLIRYICRHMDSLSRSELTPCLVKTI